MNGSVGLFRAGAASNRCVPPKGHRQGPVGLRSFHRKGFITFRLCKPVIYEIGLDSRDKRVFASTLKWKVKGRNYYRVGDVIFISPVSQKMLPKMYPTLASKDKQKSWIQVLVDSEFFGPSPEILVGQSIWSISPFVGHPGYGIVTTKPVLFFGKTAVVLSDEAGCHYTTETFNDQYAITALAKSLSNIVPVLVFTAEVMQAVLTGAAKSAISAVTSRSVAVYVAKKGALSAATDLAKKQAARALLKAAAKNLALATAKASLAFATAFLKQLSTDAQEEAIRKKAARNEKIDYKLFKAAIQAGTVAFVTTLISECFGSMVSKLGLETALKEFLVKKLIALITTDSAGVLIKAYQKAALDRERNKAAYKPSYMSKEMEDWLKGQVLGLIKDFATSVRY